MKNSVSRNSGRVEKHAVASHLIALEPRMMFDGAAVATATESLSNDGGVFQVTDNGFLVRN